MGFARQGEIHHKEGGVAVGVDFMSIRLPGRANV